MPGRLITVENTTLGLSDDYLITEVQFYGGDGAAGSIYGRLLSAGGQGDADAD
jgi:hypothetical protein